MIVTADESLRAQLRGLRTTGQVAACAKFRDRPCSAVEQRAHAPRCGPSPAASSCSTPRSTSTTGRSSSCSTRPHRSCVAERGIGYVTAAEFYIAWSHPGRCHSEAAFARLGGTSPVAGDLRPEPDPPPPQPRRRPPTQPGALPRRRHQAALRPDHQGLHRPPRRRGQDRTRSHPLHQALPRPPRLATPRTPADPHLTDIEASRCLSFGRRSFGRLLVQRRSVWSSRAGRTSAPVAQHTPGSASGRHREGEAGVLRDELDEAGRLT